MAVNLGSLLVSLGLDSGEFKSGLDQVEKQFRRTERNFDKIGKKMAGIGRNLSVAVTAPLAALGVASFKAASDAAEMESAFDVSFGASAKSVKKWAEETGNAMGRSTQEMMGMAASFQDILKKQMNPGEASELSKTLTVLTQDLASFKNLSNEVAQQKIFSGLIGEAEPLRAVGVLLSATAVEAKALEMGLAATKKEITEGAKVQARAALIMEQLSDAQGDVIRTSDSTENQIKTASAAFEEMRVAIGQKLIPALTPLITGITSMLEKFNELSPGMQKAIVVTAGLAAAIGPLLIIIGSVVSAIKPMLAMFAVYKTAATTATVATGSLVPALAGLRAMFISLATSMGPWIIALGVVAGAIYLLTRRSVDGAKASELYRNQQEKLKEVQDKVAGASERLATATGDARREAIANAHAVREETKQYLLNARAALAAARAKLESVKAQNLEDLQNSSRSTRGAGGGIDPIISQGRVNQNRINQANKDFVTQLHTTLDAAKALADVEKAINAPAPVSVPAVSTGTGTGKTKKGGRGATGRSPAEIEAMFADEQRRLEMEALSAKERLTTNLEDRVDLQYEMLEMERQQRLTEIDQNADFSAAQKDALKKQIEALYGTAVQIDERGNIIAHGNKGLIAQQIEQDRAFELERQNADMAQVRFDEQRELLQLDYELADTQAERARIAADILRLEQEYRRNQLEMVLASATASDAEKKRAQAILDSLAAIEAGETAASGRANETDVQRYMRDINKTPEQINEAIDGIRIDGLESLNDGLVDAIMGVKSLGDVFSNVAKQIIADLLRIAVQKAIIAPLANAIFGGENGGGILAGLKLGGARAAGGPVRGGTTYLVGEKGPEMFTASRSGKIIPNHELGGMGGSIQVIPSPYFDVVVDGRVQRAAPAIAQGGAQLAGQQAMFQRSRRLA